MRRKTSSAQDSNYLKALGIAIRARREGLNLTQEKFAEITDFDRTYISLLERGKRNLSILNLQVVACSLKCEIADLVKEAEIGYRTGE